MGKSPMNVVVLLGGGEGQAGMAGTDRRLSARQALRYRR